MNRQRLRDAITGLIAALADYDVWRSDPTVATAFAEAHDALEADRRLGHTLAEQPLRRERVLVHTNVAAEVKP